VLPKVIRSAVVGAPIVLARGNIQAAAVNDRASVFTEYVGDYPEHSGPSHLINSGAVYRLTPTQQIDAHVAFGLNRNAPSFVAGVGSSFRLDDLFAGSR
jgi:outer membrane putative beta-barrel porin/alpha-amylase